jgi:pyroglutamyl-peptidase
MKLLLTGFEPFGGSSLNPSEQVVKRLGQIEIRGIELATSILPVDQVESTRKLIHAYQEATPDVVLCLGEASRRPTLSIERVAVNLMDYRIADNQGNMVVDRQIVPDGPAAYFVTLPVRRIYEKLIAEGIPVELSLSAGAFLCNQVLYTILHTIALKKLPVQAGFIHLPSLPEQVANQNKTIPSMSVDTSLLGVIKAVESIREWRHEAGFE